MTFVHPTKEVIVTATTERSGFDHRPEATPPPPPASPRRIGAFLVAVVALGWLGPLIDRAVAPDEAGGPGQLLWVLLPVGMALGLRRFGGDGFADSGLRRFRMGRGTYLANGSFYPIVMLLAAAGGLAVGHVELAEGPAVARFAAIAGIALVPYLFAAIGEEFGWRGYLVPRLEALGVHRLANHAIVGVAWGVWHFPYLTTAWDTTDQSVVGLAVRVVIGTTVAAVVYGEIRLRTGSLWPAVAMHATGNAIATGLLDDDVLTRVSTRPCFSPGIDSPAVIALTTVVAVVLYRWNRSSVGSVER